MLIRFGLLFVCALAVISGGILLATRVSVDQAVKRESIDKAMHYAQYMASRVSDLEGLIATANPDEEQIAIIKEIRKLGDVFRFKLFDAEGRLVLISDDDSIRGVNTAASEADPEPLQVAETQQPIIDVFDGSAKPDRPDFYAEAYIALLNAEAQTYGVVEVYVDQTATREYLRDSFKAFGISLAAFCVFLFGAPYAGYQIQRSLTERSRKDAEFLARYDPLTGLINRREFVDQANSLLADGKLSAVCFVDADKFKAINDVHGHAAGDRYLTHIAEIMRNNTRPGDLVSRFGGDEFVIGFKDINLNGVTRRIRAILTKAAEDFHHNDSVILASISVGVAACDDEKSLDALLSHADTALYHAKANGKNTFSIYGDEMGEDLRKRNALEERLRCAISKKEFNIHYQPLVDGRTKEVLGYEALLRLEDDEGADIPPSIFIPIAEELGLITEIGTWVIRTATQDIARTTENHSVAINLSAAQFSDGDLPEIVRDALDQSRLTPQRLELEITESLLLEDDPKVEFQIDAIKEMGVSIAMDDFGTGFSSLSYLWKFGFDRLKIDRSFIAALECDPVRSREIIETILMLGDRLGMRTTAEGIETEDQSDLLSALGCDMLQGYLFGHPANLAENCSLRCGSHEPDGESGSQAS
ncbi:bifunctional diguanylate cyclase/phosphodiesterase [uncultured Roseobacter sp.]|uniref:putative bifunctional diguanylate cyclase/phosphodiesterase n=1 Tax=uncultured Roseobacter sp. TaxID=114847 RepID=UPI00260A1545|nr:bifunctional diguanylate cyclase/phosphodiesterase [uncultured Roseobacter sp.]